MTQAPRSADHCIVETKKGPQGPFSKTNAPSTAIDVIGRGVRTLAYWHEPPKDEMPAISERMFVPPLAIEDLFADFIGPIPEDGIAQLIWRWMPYCSPRL